MEASGRPLKRARRRVTADLRDFLSFPAPDGGGGCDWPAEPFRSSVRAFLSRHARPRQAPPSSHLQAWRVEFRIGDCEPAAAAEEWPGMAVVELEVVEEDVRRARSVYCDQCRVVGWSCHPVCGKRYHFIIRSDTRSSTANHYTCIRCQSPLSLSDFRCSSCNYEVMVDDLEDWAYSQLDDTTHLLHGVVHANGYGHLLRVNGREGGSKFLTGQEIMSFWDRLCRMIHVRKVTVIDIAKKHGMEYRLLHAVIHGNSWYGGWGYQFGSGSYALSADAYRHAVKNIACLPLAPFFSQHSRSARSQLQDTLSLYQSLCDHQIVTVRDLFCYMTNLLHDFRQETVEYTMSEKKVVVAPLEQAPTWSTGDVERVEKAMINILSAASGSGWVSWRSLKGATCFLGPPRLLDYCLKELNGKQVANGKVAVARCNADRNNIEFRLVDASLQQSLGEPSWKLSAELLLADLRFLYEAILDPAGMNRFRRMGATADSKWSSAAAKILDCKQFIKHYDEALPDAAPHNPSGIRVWCNVELLDQPNDYMPPPQELLILPPSATVAELKLQATRAFQETYLMFQRFQAEQLLDYGDVKDSTQIKLLVGMAGTVWVRGRCFGDEQRLRQFRMERGMENWTVDCHCGAEDDDGERMLACDSCGVWQHTRCSGIKDEEKVPAKFICAGCSGLGCGVAASDSNFGDKALRCNDELPLGFAGGAKACGRLTTVGG